MAIPGSIPAQQAAPPGTYFPTPMMSGSGVSGLTAEEASQLGEPGNRPPVGFNPYSWNHLYKRWPGDTQRKDFPPMRKDDSGVPGRPGSPPVGGKGGTMGTRDDRWTTPGGTNLLDKAHDAAGNRWGRPSGPAINPSGGDPIWKSRGITKSGGYKQGIHADPAIQEQIRQATETMAAKFAAEQARLGPPGSEARIKEAQERIDATSYTPEQSAAIREGRAAEARIDPVGKAAERKERRQEGSATRKERIQERKDEATEIREAREARDVERRKPPEVPLTLEQQREQRLRERFRFDQYKYEADREFKVRAERMRIQEVAMRMTKAGVTMTPEIRGQIAKLEARRTRLESEYKISGNEIGRLRDEISDAMTPGGEKDQDDLDDIMPLLVAAERRSQDLLKRLGEITEAGAKIEAEEIKKAQELLKTGNPGLAAAASTSGSYGGGVKGGGQAAPQQGAAPQQAAPQQAAAPAVVYSSVLDKSVLVEMIESYASAKNIPIEDVYQRLGATPP